MVMIFVQTLFLFLLVKVLLRDWRAIAILDISYALACSLVSSVAFTTMGIYIWLPLLVMVMLFTWWHTRSFSEAFFIGLQVGIWSIVIDHISSLLAYLIKGQIL